MNTKARMIAVVLALVLVLAAFPTASAYAACYNAATFVPSGETYRDGTKIAPGVAFNKTWTVRNTGTCTWTSYSLVNVDTGSDPFGATSPVPIAGGPYPPGSLVTLTVPMTAPTTPGVYKSNWKLSDGGTNFGVGWGGGTSIYAKLIVVAPPAVKYDFAANASSAVWTSGSTSPTSPVPFGNMPGSIDGSAISGSTFKLEDGSTPANSILFTSDNYPHSAPHFIQAVYSGIPVNSGDRFQATVGCETSANCWVSFSLQFQYSSGGTIYTLGTFLEKNEGLTRKVDINLNSLAGKKVDLILRAYNYRYPAGANASAIWGDPVIVGTGGSIPPITDGWNEYVDSSATDPFIFKYPSGSLTNFGDDTITLPTGTGVVKTLKISKPPVSASPAICLTTNSDASGTYTSYMSSATIPVDFNIEEFSSGGKEWIVYTAIKPAPTSTSSPSCVSLEFRLNGSATPADDALIKSIADTLVFK